MTTAVLRKELQNCIAGMPEQNLYMLRPLLLGLSKPRMAAEPASGAEAALVDGAMEEYEIDPSCFTDGETAKKEAGLA